MISMERAREFASYWQSPGPDGIGMAQFASTGAVTEALLNDIHRGLRDPGCNQAELRMLDEFVNAQTVTVWTVGSNEAGYLPTSAPEWHLDYADALDAFVGLLEGAPTDLEGDECECVEEVCAACSHEAHIAAYVRDEVPSVIGGKVFGDARALSLILRAESKASVVAYWVEPHEVTVAEYRSVSEVGV